MECITAWLDGLPDTWLRAGTMGGLVISLVALGVVGWQMYMSRARYKELRKHQKCLKDDQEILKNNQSRILDYLHREFDVRFEAHTNFDAPVMAATVGIRKQNKDEKKPTKPTFLLTLRRWLGKLRS